MPSGGFSNPALLNLFFGSQRGILGLGDFRCHVLPFVSLGAARSLTSPGGAAAATVAPPPLLFDPARLGYV